MFVRAYAMQRPNKSRLLYHHDKQPSASELAVFWQKGQPEAVLLLHSHKLLPNTRRNAKFVQPQQQESA